MKVINRMVTAVMMTGALAMLPTLASDKDKHHDKKPTTTPAAEVQPKDQATSVDAILKQWDDRPQLAARQMIEKYGKPDEMSSRQLVWNDAGSYERITVYNLETRHDFPVPHVDFVEHTVIYEVPADKIDDLSAFDGSITVNRTAGELSARCDKEAHNLMALNLANDIVKGSKTFEQARTALAEMVSQESGGRSNAYATRLQFEPMTVAEAAFKDEPAVAGASARRGQTEGDAAHASTRTSATGAEDAETLATVMVLDTNEINTAKQAQKEDISEPVKEYARMLQEDHSENLQETSALAQRIGAKPADTSQIEKLKKDAARELAELSFLAGKDFEKAFIRGEIEDHQKALELLDARIEATDDPAVKQHLMRTREHIRHHLEQAKNL